MPFVKLTMPSPDDPLDAEASRYDAKKHHEGIAAALEELEAGRYLRLIINCPPRHGKSELASRKFPPWFAGRDPYRSIIFATYNEEFALDFGREVRETIQSTPYQEIFPEVALRKGSAASNRLKTTQGGDLFFVGIGGALSGRGADLLIIDDPIKDAEEAASLTIRNKRWEWFTKVASTRLLSSVGRICIIQTRWHEDDLVGRLTDPSNPAYVESEAKKWHLIDLPALAIEDDDILGRKRGEALWPERFPAEYLRSAQALDPLGFSALYQGRPSPEDGVFFKAENWRQYSPTDLPKNLRYFAASDHAVGLKQKNDFTVIIIVGVDEDYNVWVVDLWRKRADTSQVVDKMVWFMKKYPLGLWWAEQGHISKSIGPFLRKKMSTDRVMCTIDESPVAADKTQRAQSISGWMQLGKVYWPRLAPWIAEAKSEILKFPNGTHDDVPDALSHIGMGLSKQWKPSRPPAAIEVVREGTLGWLKMQSKYEKLRNKAQLAAAVY